MGTQTSIKFSKFGRPLPCSYASSPLYFLLYSKHKYTQHQPPNAHRFQTDVIRPAINYMKETLMPIPCHTFYWSFKRDFDVIFFDVKSTCNRLSPHSHPVHAFRDLVTTPCFETGSMSSGLFLSSLALRPESLSQLASVMSAATINLRSSISETRQIENTLKSAIKESKNTGVNIFLCTP